MAKRDERASHFPRIEARYGQPMDYWFGLLEELESERYADQVALLQEGHGFSRAHANAVVMYFRGSTSSTRHDSPDNYFASLPDTHRGLARAILDSLQAQYPQLELVIAWNQPILKTSKDYVFGLSASQAHLSINPFTPAALETLSSRLSDYEVLKHTIRIPLDWSIDHELLADLVAVRLSELAESA